MPGSCWRLPARVHGPWNAAWWGGDADLAAIFGPAPTLRSLDDAAGPVAAASPASWRDALLPGIPPVPPAEALVVVAGQQPVLAGGPLLVAHKAATAIALARLLQERWRRPVAPVFLLADEDHDTDEVDHVDVIDGSNGHLHRHRAPIEPSSEAFFRARWDPSRLRQALTQMTGGAMPLDDLLHEGQVAHHVARLLDRIFGPAGLQVALAHRLTAAAGLGVLRRAVTDPGPLQAVLRRGAKALAAAGLEPSFDPEDPRPLVLESRAGRRRRVSAGDRAAARRLAEHPEDFSPQAALRPVVQAAALPVVAQVVGPSEILYLGQARGLHGLFGRPAPVLVPRMEGTVVPSDFRESELDAGSAPASRLAERARAVADAARDLAGLAAAETPGLQGRARRFVAMVEQGAERLADAHAWHGCTGGPRRAALRPRGRDQDTVLAWLPQALGSGDPARWAERLVSLCRPLAPPVHLAYTLRAPPGPENAHA